MQTTVNGLDGDADGELELPAVLMAQKARMDMELEAIRLQVDARQRLAELERAVGADLNPGQWSASPAQEEVPR